MRDQLTLTFAALADPTRRAMLVRLAQGTANVSELAQPFLGKMSLPAVTKHLKVLERAGLVTKTQDAQRRPCELNPEALKNAAQWMEQYRVFWEESLDRLDEYLKTVTTESNQRKRSPHVPHEQTE
ncbi:MAG: ArsR family transcriptional regulator [Bryobacteraceae bacterium]|nr:ArsR family transcriptional regulator [Bryobacteraceae bacterium]